MLDDFEPSYSITPYYPSTQDTVKLGNKLKPSAVRSSPDVYITSLSPTKSVKPSATLTIALTDPDATSHADPAKAQMCHWIVTNITLPTSEGLDSRRVDLGYTVARAGNDGVVELEPYFSPSPPPKTGYHRYVFVVLESNSDNEPPMVPRKPEDRPHWGYGKIGAGVREWAVENSLVIVGEWYQRWLHIEMLGVLADNRRLTVLAGANFFYSKNKKQ